jgi:hypothetical protein
MVLLVLLDSIRFDLEQKSDALHAIASLFVPMLSHDCQLDAGQQGDLRDVLLLTANP